MHVCIVEAGHHKLAFEIDSLDAFLAAPAIEEDVIHFPDTTNLSVADGHGLGPRMHRVIRVNAPVRVIGGAGSFLRHARFRVECGRSEEHTSELQSRLHLVCRLLLEKKKCVSRGLSARAVCTQGAGSRAPGKGSSVTCAVAVPALRYRSANWSSVTATPRPLITSVAH